MVCQIPSKPVVSQPWDYKEIIFFKLSKIHLHLLILNFSLLTFKVGPHLPYLIYLLCPNHISLPNLNQ